MPAIAVIPSRYASTRFPGKPLALIHGRPMVEHVWRRCMDSGAFAEVIVATEDQRIVDVVEAFGGKAQLTSPDCATGTDRVAEVARGRPEIDVWVNVQGDEPAMNPAGLARLVEVFEDSSVQMATLIRPLREEERPLATAVKVVLDRRDNALYFSRSDIPFVREPGTPVSRWGHLGIYGYRRETLLRLAELEPTPLERAEFLEQLRALENGIAIRCARVDFSTQAVDVPGDIALAEKALKDAGLS